MDATCGGCCYLTDRAGRYVYLPHDLVDKRSFEMLCRGSLAQELISALRSVGVSELRVPTKRH